MDKAGWGLVIVSLSGLTGVARAADAIPFFKADPKPVMYGPVPLFVPEPKPVMYGPVLPDPGAPECGIDDQACLERHDGRVLSLASSSHARQECAESTHPERCYEAYDMMAGDFVPKPDPILSDPCAWVVLVDHQVATLSSKKMGITKRILNRGWKARTFIGACNVSSVVPLQPTAVIPMPAWTVRKGQSMQTLRAATAVPVAVNAATGPAAPAPTGSQASPVAMPGSGLGASAVKAGTPAVPAAVSAPASGASKPAPVPSATAAAPWPAAGRPASTVQAPSAPSGPPAAPAVPAPPVPSTPAPPPSPVTPTAPTLGAPGTTQPPPFARAPAVSDAPGGSATPSR